MNALRPVRLGDAMADLAPDEKARRMIRHLRDGLDLLRRDQEPRRPRQILGPGQAVRRGIGATRCDRAFGHVAFDRREAEHTFRPEPHRKRIDQLADIDLDAILRDMPPDRLPFGQRLDPGGGQRCTLDAEAGIDQHQPFAKQLAKMLRVAVRPRGADAHGLRNVVDALKHQIEPARADAARSRSRMSISHSLVMTRFRSSGSPTGSANARVSAAPRGG